ncbi:MAG TPA: hypothetical protein VHA14_16135 [Bryobacteraceae bacterium]|nr:hypothetical protein [Bryobacteraceae bacterium]
MGSSLESIKEAIGGLPEDERASLAAWLNLRSMDDWDRQMHRDFASGGRAHSLVEKVRADIRHGKIRPMPGSDSTSESN